MCTLMALNYLSRFGRGKNACTDPIKTGLYTGLYELSISDQDKGTNPEEKNRFSEVRLISSSFSNTAQSQMEPFS
jgi:hypothetical protein